MSKKRHNFFRLCSLVLAFMLTFTNMPAVAYATDGYSAEALVEDTAEASENDAITEDGEIEESEPAATDDELPAEDPAEDAEAAEEVEEPDGDMGLFGVEEIEEEEDLLGEANTYEIKFFNYQGNQVGDAVSVAEGETINPSDIPTNVVPDASVFERWRDKDRPYDLYTVDELKALEINSNYEFEVVYSELVYPTFEDNTVNKAYADPAFTNTLSNTGADTNVITYESDNTNVATVDNNGQVTIKGVSSKNEDQFVATTITAAVTSQYGTALGSASYELIVKPRNIVFTWPAKTTFDNKGTAAGYALQPTNTDIPAGEKLVVTVYTDENCTEVDKLDSWPKRAGTFYSKVEVKNGEGKFTYANNIHEFTIIGKLTAVISPTPDENNVVEFPYNPLGSTIEIARVYEAVGDDKGDEIAKAEVTIGYKLNLADEYVENCPLMKEVCAENEPYTVYWQVSKEGFETLEGSTNVMINATESPALTVNITGWTYRGYNAEVNAPSIEGGNGNDEEGAVTFWYAPKPAPGVDPVYSDVVPVNANAGDYIVEARQEAYEGYDAVSATKEFTISKKELTGDIFEILPQGDSLTYDNNPKYLLTVGGKVKETLDPLQEAIVKYSTDYVPGTDPADATWRIADELRETKAGVYNIYYYVVGGDNYLDKYKTEATKIDYAVPWGPITTTIDAARASVDNDPTLKHDTEYYYDAQPKALINNAGTSIGGEILYSVDFDYVSGEWLTESALLTKIDSATWYDAENINKAIKDAGRYNVYYYVKGNASHTNGYNAHYDSGRYYYNVFRAYYDDGSAEDEFIVQINPAILSIKADNVSVLYSGTTNAWENKCTATIRSLAGEYQEDLSTLGLIYSRDSGYNVGTYQLTVRCNDNGEKNDFSVPYGTGIAANSKPVVNNGNYLIYEYLKGEVTIEPKPATVYIDDQVKVHGMPDPTTYSYTVDGLVPEDKGKETTLISAHNIIRVNEEDQSALAEEDVKTDTDDVEQPYENVLLVDEYKALFTVDKDGRKATKNLAQDEEAGYNYSEEVYGTEVQGNYMVTFVSGDFTILYDEIDLTEPTAKEGLVYDAEKKQDLIDYGSANGNGTIYYAVVKSKENAPAIPAKHDIPENPAESWGWQLAGSPALQRTDYGTYDVYYWVKGNEGVKDIPGKDVTTPVGPISVTIARASAEVDLEPMAKLNLKYNLKEQELVKAGTATNGTMLYAVRECDPKIDDHDHQYTPEEIEAWEGTEWSDKVPTKLEAGIYDVYYYVEGKETVEDSGVKYNDTPVYGPLTVTIADVVAEVGQVPQAYTDLAYDITKGSDGLQELVKAGTGIRGTMLYAVKDHDPEVDDHEIQYTTKDFKEWTQDVPAKRAAGIYDVYYYVKGDANEEDPTIKYPDSPVYGPLTVTIADTYATFEIVNDKEKKPEAFKNLVYNGELQQLVTEGAAINGKLYYAVKLCDPKIDDHDHQYTPEEIEAWTPEEPDWTETVPKKLEAGTYDVFYYIAGDAYGDEDPKAKYLDTPVSRLEVTIAEASAEVTVVPLPYINLSYGDKKGIGEVPDGWQELVIEGAAKNGTMLYAVKDCDTAVDDHGHQYTPEEVEAWTDGEDWSEAVPTKRSAGTYDVYYYVKGDAVDEENPEIKYVDTPVYGPLTVTIEDTYAEITQEPVFPDNLIYDTTTQALLTAGLAENGTFKYKVSYRATEEDAAEPFGEWNDWNTKVPEAVKAGFYDITYFVDGKDWNGKNNCEYISTDEIVVTVPIADGLAYVKEGEDGELLPQLTNHVYDGTAQALIDPEHKGEAVDGTLKYRFEILNADEPQGEITDPKSFDDWSTDVPKAIEAMDYVVYYYADGTQDQDPGLLYLDSKVYGPYIVTIDQNDRSDSYPITEGKKLEVTFGNYINFVEYVDSTKLHNEDVPGRGNDAVAYAITSAYDLGCSINDPVTGQFRAGTQAGSVKVKITVEGNPNYIPVEEEFTVTVKGQYDEENAEETGDLAVDFVDTELQYYYGGKPVPAYVYTGSAIKPEIIVTNGRGDRYNAKTLVPGKDYTVTYSNNTKASATTKKGIATIKVKGKGNYKSTKTFEFYILKADIDDVYVGNTVVEFGKKLSPVVSYMGKTLKAGTDYSGDEIGIKQAFTGQQYAIIDGHGNFDNGQEQNLNKAGNYPGKKFAYEVVTAPEMKAFTVTLDKSVSKTYNGEPVTLSSDELVVRDKAGNKLNYDPEFEGEFDDDGKPYNDYSVSYSNNINAGTVKVVVTGLGYYKGSVKKSFKINPAKYAPIYLTEDCKDALLKEGVPYSNKGATPELYLYANLDEDHEDTGLILGKDYKVSYSNNKKAGSGNYKITFIGNYKGHEAITGVFKINPAKFEDGKISVVGEFVFNEKKLQYKYYYAKAGKNLFVTVDGVLLKPSEYKLRYYEGDYTHGEKLPAEINSKSYGVANNTVITVVALPTSTSNYVNGELRACYRVQPGNAIDISKAKFKVINTAQTSKKGKAAYTGSAIYFRGLVPGDEDYDDVVSEYDVNGKLRLEMTVKTSNGTKVFTSDSPTEGNSIAENFDFEYVNNVNRGTAKVIVTGKQEKGYAGSAVASFTISQSSVADTLHSILDFEWYEIWRGWLN